MNAQSFRFSPRTVALLKAMPCYSVDYDANSPDPFKLKGEASGMRMPFKTEKAMRDFLAEAAASEGVELPAAGGRPAKAPEERLETVSVRVEPAHAYAIELYGPEWVRQLIEDGIRAKVLAGETMQKVKSRRGEA